MHPPAGAGEQAARLKDDIRQIELILRATPAPALESILADKRRELAALEAGSTDGIAWPELVNRLAARTPLVAPGRLPCARPRPQSQRHGGPLRSRRLPACGMEASSVDLFGRSGTADARFRQGLCRAYHPCVFLPGDAATSGPSPLWPFALRPRGKDRGSPTRRADRDAAASRADAGADRYSGSAARYTRLD